MNKKKKETFKRSFDQSIRKYLKGNWINANGSTARIGSWSGTEMADANQNIIKEAIYREIKKFAALGGDVEDFYLDYSQNLIGDCDVLEPLVSEEKAEIFAYIDPPLFYCRKCKRVFEYRATKKDDGLVYPSDLIGAEFEKRKALKCKWQGCNGYLKQISFVRPCSCGRIQKMSLNNLQIKGRALLFSYLDNETDPYNYDYLDSEACFIDKETGEKICDLKDVRYYPNSPWTFSIVNEDKKLELWWECSCKAKPKCKYYPPTSPRVFHPHILSLINVDDEHLSNDASMEHNQFLFLTEGMNSISYDELKASHLDLKSPRIREKEEEEIEALKDSLGVRGIQVNPDITIAQVAYGYTYVDKVPSKLSSVPLRLKAFTGSAEGGETRGKTLAYGYKLITEGLLIALDWERIIKWLYENDCFSSDPKNMDCVMTVKSSGNSIPIADYLFFGEPITETEKKAIKQHLKDLDYLNSNVSRAVYSLLHSMSHGIIKVAGDISGLSATSFGEMIFLEDGAFLVYCNNNQGLSLGAISGLLTYNLKQFLRELLEENRNCAFDPLCAANEESRCQSCLIVPEVVCCNFNNQLGRKYLYTIPGGKESGFEMDINCGYWDMDRED